MYFILYNVREQNDPQTNFVASVNRPDDQWVRETRPVACLEVVVFPNAV